MSRNNGKRAAAIARGSDSDVDSSEEPEYNVDWLPEARSVFVVPFTEFYNSFAECPKGTCAARNWRQQHREGVLVGTKRHNNAKVGLTHGIQFEGDARPSYYIQIYEWEKYCLGPPPRQFRHAVPELFTGLYVFRVLGGTPVHLTWRGDLSRLKKTCFGHIAQPGGASGGTVPLDALPSVKPEGRAVPEPGFQASSVV